MEQWHGLQLPYTSKGLRESKGWERNGSRGKTKTNSGKQAGHALLYDAMLAGVIIAAVVATASRVHSV